MPDPAITGNYEALEAALRQPPREHYVLRLYVTGGTFVSLRAVANVRHICERYLHDDYELAIVDLRQQPEFCAQSNLVAAPTLVKESPAPVQRMMGDMSDTASVLAGLGIILHDKASGS